MANLFLNIPVPAGNGPGAAVDVSTLGKTKSIVCGGVFDATVNLEFANDAGAAVWAPLATFHQSGNLTIDLAAHWVRANVSNYKSGAANVDVGSSDAGAVFAMLPGGGAPVDISAMPLFKTAVAPITFAGNIEVSEDGIDWAQIFSMQNGGAQSREIVGQFARVNNGSGEDVWLGATSEGGGGAGSTEHLFSIYGDGSFGDHVTAGDEVWGGAIAPPGAPVVPGGSSYPYAFFNNLTISPGDSLNPSAVIFVKETLTIGSAPNGRIHVNGGDGGGPFSAGAPGAAPAFATSDGFGGAGNPAFAPGPGAPGVGGQDRPALSSATRIGGAGGPGDAGLVNPGGAGGVDAPEPSWPYSLAQAIAIADALMQIAGGNGGGGGGNGASSNSGSGGGGGGVLIIFAKTIVAPAGSLQAIGGVGGVGFSFENEPGGGGGGGTGGTIIVVTENATLLGTTDVSGGAGGAGVGVPAPPGLPGGPGEAIAFNPMLAAQIPV